MDVNTLYETGYRFYAAGKYEDAEGIFRLLTSYAPKQGEIWMALGATLQLQKKFSEALDCFGVSALLDTAASNPTPHAHAAECLWALEEMNKAKIALKSAILIAKKQTKYESLLEKLTILNKRWSHG